MAQSELKQISIDDLIPGMYVVDVDLPWYRTPFLTHKRLIEDTVTIDTMRRCGIRTVIIDPQKGKDIMAKTATESAGAISDGVHSDAAASVTAAMEQADSANALYTAAEEAIDRLFDRLMHGGPPPSAIAKATVTTIMRWMFNDRAALLTQLAIRKIKRFDHSLTAHALDTCILSLAVS
ncbi:MAG: DUF3391 domain-containing protein, partial [Nitrospira sp.]|nr:DUF3391 domain-containing protein [Nitrospira sp.]